MDVATRAAVRERAADCREFRQRKQVDSPLAPLHVEHIIPRKHGGSDGLDNLALACGECNLHKGSNLTGIDPETKQITRLFDPRRDRWADHFAWDALRILGVSAVGRTTVRVLELNAPARPSVRLAGRSA